MGRYTVLGPDGRYKSFKIEGDQPTDDELRRIGNYLYGGNAPETLERQRSYMSDLGSEFKSGIADIARAYGSWTGDEDADAWGKAIQDQAAKELDPVSVQAQSQGITGGGGLSAFGLGAARTVPQIVGGVAAAGVATALAPEVAIPAAAIRVLSKVPGISGIMSRLVAGGMTEQAAARTLLAGMAGDSAVNFFVGGGMNATEARDAIMELAQSDPDAFRNSPLGQKYLAKHGNIEKAAREAARDVGYEVGLKTGTIDALVGMPGGLLQAGILARGLGRGIGGAARGAGYGAAFEGAEEGTQSGLETIVQNMALQEAGSPVGTFEGAGRAALEGAALGAGLGGILGGAGGAFGRATPQQAPSEAEAQTPEATEAQPLALPAPSVVTPPPQTGNPNLVQNINGLGYTLNPTPDFGRYGQAPRGVTGIPGRSILSQESDPGAALRQISNYDNVSVDTGVPVPNLGTGPEVQKLEGGPALRQLVPGSVTDAKLPSSDDNKLASSGTAPVGRTELPNRIASGGALTNPQFGSANVRGRLGPEYGQPNVWERISLESKGLVKGRMEEAAPVTVGEKLVSEGIATGSFAPTTRAEAVPVKPPIPLEQVKAALAPQLYDEPNIQVEKNVSTLNRLRPEDIKASTTKFSQRSIPVDAFRELGNAQRGAPETAMVNAQKVLGGGVMSHAIEHTGDLTHRMTNMMDSDVDGIEYVAPKVKSVLRNLKSEYGFMRDFEENLKNNGVDRAAADEALKRYAEEHRKLPVYNRPQWLAREAAVALGEQNIPRAIKMLEGLQKLIDSGEYGRAARSFGEKDGNLQRFSTQATSFVQPRQSPENVARLQKAIPAFRRALETQLRSAGIKNFDLKIVDSLGLNNDAAFTPGEKALFEIATNPVLGMDEAKALEYLRGIMNHEIVHALVARGAIDPKDATFLEKYVKNTKAKDESGKTYGETWYEWAEREYKPKYGRLPQAEMLYVEEAIAEAFKVWTVNPTAQHGRLSNIFRKIAQFFRRMFQAQRQSGVDDIFRKFISGEAASLTPESYRDVDISQNPIRGLDNNLVPERQQPAKRKGSVGEVKGPVFYSALHRAVRDLKIQKAPGKDWSNILRKLQGVKKEEVEWTGAAAWAESVHRPITKDEMLDYIKAHDIEVKDVLLDSLAKDWWNYTISDVDADLVEKYNLLDVDAELVAANKEVNRISAEMRRLQLAHRNEPTIATSEALSKIESAFTAADVRSFYAREQFERMMEKAAKEHAARHGINMGRMPGFRQHTWSKAHDYKELLFQLGPQYKGDQFDKEKGSHWGDQNIIAHARFARIPDDTLLIEEIQSDWHQKGRKLGYKTGNEYEAQEELRARRVKIREEFENYMEEQGVPPDVRYTAFDPLYDNFRTHGTTGVPRLDEMFARYRALIEQQMKMRKALPDAPFKTTWHELAMKRMIRWAADNGYKRIAWTPGNMQAARYNQLLDLKKIQYGLKKEGQGKWALTVHTRDGLVQDVTAMDDDNLRDILGDNLANRILSGEGRPTFGTQYQGKEITDNLELVGGEGMRHFYDTMLVSAANKIAGPHNIRVGTVDLTNAEGDTQTFHSLELNESIKDFAKQGFTKYSLGRRVAQVPNHNRHLDVSYAAAYDAIYNIGDLAYRGLRLNKIPNMPAHLPQEPVYNLLRQFQARSLPLAQFVDAVNKLGVKIDDAVNPMIQYTLMRGLVKDKRDTTAETLHTPAIDATRSLGFTEAEEAAVGALNPRVKEWLTSMQRRNKEHDRQFAMQSLFMIARHAPERNAWIQDRQSKNANFNAQEYGSGLSDAEAQQVMAWFASNPRYQRVLSASELWYNVIKDTIRRRVESGLEIDISMDPASNKFKYYVPLRGLPKELDPEHESGFMPGLSTMGREDRRAFGRNTIPTEVLPSILQQNFLSIDRAEHNRIMNDLADLIEQNPQLAGMAELEAGPPMKQVLVKQRDGTRKAEWREDTNYRNPRTDTGRMYTIAKHTVEEDGRPVTKERLIRWQPGMERLAKFLNGTDTTIPGEGYAVLKAMRTYNNFLGRMITAWNPEYMFVNFERDVMAALGNVQQWDKAKSGTVVKDALLAAKSIMRHEVNPSFNDQWTDTYKRLRALGGTTQGYGFSSFEEIQTQIDDLSQQPGKIKQTLEFVKRHLEGMNAGFENATRVAVYRAMMDAGYSEQAAAYAAKTTTINFDERGAFGNFMNAFYIFYNASIQGSFAIMTAAVRSEKLRMMMGGIVMFGFIMDTLNRMMSPEDEDGNNMYDQMQEYLKEHNLIMMIPGTKQAIKLPLPYLYHSIFNAGRNISAAMWGERDVGTAVGNTFANVVEGFNPLGGTTTFLNFVAPTVLDPIVDLSMNEDFTGKAIYPEDAPYGAKTPASQLYWNNTSGIWTGLSELIRIPGTGTDKTPGLGPEVSPNQLEYVFDTLLGGVGQMANRFFKLAEAPLNPDIELEANDFPFVRRFWGQVGGRAQKDQFFKMRDEYMQLEAEVKDARADGEPERIRYIRENKPDMWANMGRFKALNNRRNTLLRQIKKLQENERIPEASKRDRIERMKEQADQLIAEMLALGKDKQ